MTKDQVKKDLDLLRVLDWGCLDFAQAKLKLDELFQKRKAKEIADTLVLVEHPLAALLGQLAQQEQSLFLAKNLAEKGLVMHQTPRASGITVHALGQLAAYPITGALNKDPHDLVLKTLTACQKTADSYGLKTEFSGQGEESLCLNGQTLAEMALPENPDLTGPVLTLNISPTNQDLALMAEYGKGAASLAQGLGFKPDISKIKRVLVSHLAEELGYTEIDAPWKPIKGHPRWLVRKAPPAASIENMESLLTDHGLCTVCQSAHCPNLGECFNKGTATFMIMGSTCTRNCRFCAVDHGKPGPLDPNEPQELAKVAKKLGLRYSVVTSVTRDDLPDGGAEHFALTIEALKKAIPGCKVEVLIPDLKACHKSLNTVFSAKPDVLNHNIETVKRLYPKARPQAVYERSLEVLAYASKKGMLAKSGIMLGLGETDSELLVTLKDLRKAGCKSLTLGQYLAPSKEHVPMVEYVTPSSFAYWEQIAKDLGFMHVASGPLVRSSYRAEELFCQSPKSEESLGKEKICA